jgi:hypothetical protein
VANPKTTFEFDGDIKKVLAKLDELDAKIAMTGKKSGSAGSDMLSGFEGAVAGIAKVTAALGAAYAALSTAGKAIGTAAEFEQLQTRLENMYGSVEKGREAFQKFQEVAATTPYSLQGVVEAGASLKAFGVDAEKMIKPVSDLAAFMGVDVVEAAQAFGRAMAGGAGAADVLRDRGILQLVKSFKGIDDLTKLTLPQFRKALIETIQNPAAGIVGATDKMSKTFKGAYSNMFDAVDQLANVMGKKLLPAATSVMQSISGMVSGLLPKQSALLRENSIEFNALASMITDVNTAQEVRAQAITDMQAKYGSYIGNIDLEKASFEALQLAIAAANAEFEKKIKIQAAEELLSAQMEKQVAAQKKLYEMELDYRKRLATNDFSVTNQGGAYTPSEYMKQAMEQAIGAQEKRLKELAAEYKNLYAVMVEGAGIAADYNKKVTTDPPAPDPVKTRDANANAGKAAAEAYIESFRAAISSGSVPPKLVNDFEEWYKKLQIEQLKIARGFDLIGAQSAPDAGDSIKKMADETTENLKQMQGQLESIVGNLARAGVAGENMGEALKKTLQELIVKATTLAAVFGLLQLIPGGSAFAGGFGAFLGKGMGLGALLSPESGGAASSVASALQSQKPIVVEVTGALEGQKFVTTTIRQNEARLGGRVF